MLDQTGCILNLWQKKQPVVLRMGDLKSCSVWRKAAFLLTHLAYVSFLVAFVTPGWSSAGPGLVRCDRRGNCGRSWYAPTEAFITLGYICVLPALVLIQCCVLLDELNNNKIVPIVFIALDLAAGMLVSHSTSWSQ